MAPQQFTSQDITKLIARVSLKDRAAFDLLYRATNAKLFGVCLRVLSDRAEAEEALQEVFVKIWTKADRFVVSELSPISWLVAIARNHAIDRIRARGHRTATIDEANELADERREPWYEGNTLVVPVYEEVLVSETKLMLREVVRLQNAGGIEQINLKGTVRRDVVDIEEIDREGHVSRPEDAG